VILPQDASAARPAMAWMFAAAVLLLGIGTVSANLDVGTWLVIAATSLVAVGLFSGARLRRILRARSVLTVLAAGALLGTMIMAFAPAVGDLRYSAGILVIGAVGLHTLLLPSKWWRAAMAVVVVGHFVLMAWMLTVSGPPTIDVHQFQQEAASALLGGQNPYALRYENLAGPGSPYYSPEVEDGNFLTFGFVYPPMSLLMALPGYVVAGDYRFAALAAISMTALACTFIRPGAVGVGAALLILLSPVTPRIVYWGWTEPFVAVALAASALAAFRAPRAAPWAVGLLIATKQYVAPLYLVALVVLQRVRDRAGWTRATLVPPLVASLTIAPFLVWDASNFVYSTISVHSLQPFRADSLSVPALLVRAGLEAPPSWLGFVLAGVVLVAVLLRAPRTVAGFCGGGMLILLAFFLFGKQAHMNYYFLVIAGLSCGVAAAMNDRLVGSESARQTT